MTRKKVQITLPIELKLSLEEQSKNDFMSLSSWIERAVLFYMEKKGLNKSKKLIDLGI